MTTVLISYQIMLLMILQVCSKIQVKMVILCSCLLTQSTRLILRLSQSEVQADLHQIRRRPARARHVARLLLRHQHPSRDSTGRMNLNLLRRHRLLLHRHSSSCKDRLNLAQTPNLICLRLDHLSLMLFLRQISTASQDQIVGWDSQT